MQKIKLTIAIPALNEEKTLPYVLSSVLSQNNTNYKITQLILVSDGSTDTTATIMQNFKSQNPTLNVKVIEGKTRLGKVARLNQIYSLSTGDALCILDADIQIAFDVISKLVAKIQTGTYSLAVAHQLPQKPNNFTGQVIYAGYKWWEDVRLSVKENFDHPQNFYGAASVYSKKFYSHLQIPKELVDERGYIYFSAKDYGKFAYVMSAIIHYHPVSTLSDFFKQTGRNRGTTPILIKKFGNQITNEYSIPLSLKIKKIVLHLIASPLYMSLFMLLKGYTHKIKYFDPLISQGFWSTTESTKKILN